jgi:hypothetical protein
MEREQDSTVMPDVGLLDRVRVYKATRLTASPDAIPRSCALPSPHRRPRWPTDQQDGFNTFPQSTQSQCGRLGRQNKASRQEKIVGGGLRRPVGLPAMRLSFSCQAMALDCGGRLNTHAATVRAIVSEGTCGTRSALGDTHGSEPEAPCSRLCARPLGSRAMSTLPSRCRMSARKC